MDKRYQIFVSSTFSDLQEERQEVMHALLELDCMPSGMELFPAANESQWNLIKKVIDDCDYYILIMGGRYGSIGPDGISYTEMEYRYAASIGKPSIAFLHRNIGKVIAEKTETSPEGKEKLKTFRESVERKMCKHWDSPHELGSVVSRSMIQLIKSTPAVGWVRADELADKDATMELLKLRRKVDELEREIASARSSAPKGTEGLAQGDELTTLKYKFRSTSEEGYPTTNWTATFEASWNDLFAAIAPLMIHEAAESSLKQALDSFVRDRNHDSLYKDGKTAGLAMSRFVLNEDDYQTTKIQLRALGLIVQNDKARSVKDTGTYWKLTPYGDEVMTRLRAIRTRKDHLHTVPPSATDGSDAAKI